ncbi:alpha/beta hydrolase [Methanofollis fontis]|uniref:Alpha/beta hydrolase n=1 Tax=Methanofollis fontis TaxID=2052832 RepID=A0A483CRN4_9EURY|nr:alpha/beta hydrolase [Methanofollis fontis]TAJ45785.1 alpha/beta hydrolase [Methanofollis fontis]
MIATPGEEDLLLIQGSSSFLLVGIVQERFALPVNASDNVYFEPVRPGDLVCVSAPEGGSVRAAAMLLLLVRDHHYPVFALPKDHPGSAWTPMVLSTAPALTLSCEIRRGTHPDQHLICSSAEFSGVMLRGGGDGVICDGLPAECTISYICIDRALTGE